MNRLRELTRKQITVYSVLASVIVAVLAAILYAGNYFHTYPAALVAVDSLSESKPDSASLMLRKLSSKDFGSKSDRMYYALLKIKVSNNLYEPQKDSTIFRVVDYFDKYGDKDKRREAYYYLGKYYIEHNDAPYALKCFQTSLDLSDDETPLRFKSKVYSQYGNLFLEQDMYEDALLMCGKSYTCDSILKDTVNMIHGLRDIGQIYRHLNLAGSCESYLKNASSLAASCGNKYLEHTVFLSMISMYLKEGKTSCALNLLKKTLPYIDSKTISPAYSLAMEAYDKIGAEDSAFVYANRLLSVGNIYAKETSLSVLISYYSKRNDCKNVVKYLKIYDTFSDSIRKINSADAVAKMHAFYNYSLREKENASLLLENKEKTYYCVLSVFLISFLCVLYLLFHIRSKAKYANLNSLYEHLGKMYDTECEQNEMQILLKDKKISELTLQLKNLDLSKSIEVDNYRKTIRELTSSLKEAVVVADQRKSRKLAVYETIRQQLAEEKILSDKVWNDILSSINFIYPDFKEKIYDKCGLFDNEYRICVLSKLGFLNSEMSILVGRSQGAITQMRANLYKKLTGCNGKSRQFDELIKSL